MTPVIELLLPVLVAALAAAPADPAAPADSAAAPRIVRQLEPIEVRAMLKDPRSSQTLRTTELDAVRGLPIQDLADAWSLQAGVVASPSGLTVRGGRPGASSLWMDGLPLDEPIRHRAMDVPLLALSALELTTGALEAAHGATLAGTLRLVPLAPAAAWSARTTWSSDARTGTHHDRLGGMASGPLPLAGYGLVAAAEALLDDTHLPNRRATSRRDLLGGSFGWRAHNRLAGSLRLAPRAGGRGPVLQLLTARRVDQPFDAAWALDGWVVPCTGLNCSEGPAFFADSVPGSRRWRAADHVPITDDRRSAAWVTWASPETLRRVAAAVGWTGSRRLTSLGGSDDEAYLGIERGPVYGYPGSPGGDAFHAYAGDVPFYRRERADSWHARLEADRWNARGDRLRGGLGFRYDEVELRELDVSTRGTGIDSLRAYHAWAPGGYGFAQGRWGFEGMVLNAGLRAEWFTAGPQAERQSRPAAGKDWIALSPRLGLAFAISDRDVMAIAYSRLHQPPARDFLYDSRRRVDWRRPLGDPAIGPATAITYEATLQHLFSRAWSAQASVFYREWFDEPGARALDPERPGLGARYLAVDEGHVGGLELALAWRPGPRARADLAWTFMDARGSSSLAEGFPTGPRFGPRVEPIADLPLDWDQRHTFVATTRLGPWRGVTLDLGTWIASGLPWTPRERGVLLNDPAAVNSRRLPWSESTTLGLRAEVPRWTHVALGLEVRNLFDHRGAVRATLDGYPNPYINTIVDDYGAHRTETGLGAAFWEPGGPSVPAGWIRVHDPRLDQAPRALRLRVETRW